MLTLLALAVGANALAIRDGVCDCSFKIKATGDVTKEVFEDGEGEVLGGNSQTSFCLNGNTIIDPKGNGCFWTPPTYVLQCDVGATPAAGFSIGCDGLISFNGQTTFFECHNGIDDEVNLYSKPDEGVVCGSVQLWADNCHAECKPPPPTPTPQPSSGCPLELPAGYEFPHLIIPVDSSKPDTAPGTSFFGEVSSTVSSIFNFDIPSSDSGKTCEVWFTFPTQAELVTSSFTLSGNGAVEFWSLKGVATTGTTFNNAPAKNKDLGKAVLAPGNAYKIDTVACPAGQAVSYEIAAVGDTNFRYFQDFNECPIGMYIIPK